MKKAFLPAAFFAAGTLLIASSFAQDLPSCKSRTVTYSSFDDRFSAKMAIQAGPVNALVTGEKQFTPQGSRWMIVAKPDFMKPGSWTTVVWVRDSGGGVPQMLTFTDHGNGGINIRWLNEKLLFGSVWWGRIVSTDFVYDVEEKRFIYREMANYGDLVQPCK